MFRNTLKEYIYVLVEEIFLAEGILQDLKVKYPNVANEIEQASKEIKPKYLRWYAGIISKWPTFFEETANSLIEKIKKFDELVSRGIIKGSDADITRYNRAGKLFSLVQDKEGELSKRRIEVDLQG